MTDIFTSSAVDTVEATQSRSGALMLVHRAPIATAASEASLAILQSPALPAFIRERIEQVERHGFTPEHDALQDECELARGAAAYITAALRMELGEDPGSSAEEAHAIWPYGDLFRPTDYKGCLIKAVAMLWAEIDRVIAAERLIGDIFGHATIAFEPKQPGRVTVHRVSKRRRCHVCGCNDDNACMTEDGPCAWAAADLCSACLGKLNQRLTPPNSK